MLMWLELQCRRLLMATWGFGLLLLIVGVILQGLINLRQASGCDAASCAWSMCLETSVANMCPDTSLVNVSPECAKITVH